MRQKRWFCLILPMYIFSILFVLGPLLYMIALSFATNHEGLGVTFHFTLGDICAIFSGSHYDNHFGCGHWLSLWLLYG